MLWFNSPWRKHSLVQLCIKMWISGSQTTISMNKWGMFVPNYNWPLPLWNSLDTLWPLIHLLSKIRLISSSICMAIWCKSRTNPRNYKYISLLSITLLSKSSIYKCLTNLMNKYSPWLISVGIQTVRSSRSSVLKSIVFSSKTTTRRISSINCSPQNNHLMAP